MNLGNMGITFDLSRDPLCLTHNPDLSRTQVTRTFGDIEAKLTKYGGNPKVVIATPEINSFRFNTQQDFIVLASNYNRPHPAAPLLASVLFPSEPN